ncbi:MULTISPECIES: hypothetical protein [unclassified Neisseria]|uniref:hypothetical protein n=1 Tax=unclassified Neisseria TaxID=2623750 RepID=UPI001071CB36|nr:MULTISPECIES: hypothetical protein [unclassified Neisseria]MBF0804073.1 hypothetical protein [Neisseria sp. 19428wB4_WF04]TFU43211.1 hypothetical protein E4T99_06830 [Neisseria sp. WF04]
MGDKRLVFRLRADSGRQIFVLFFECRQGSSGRLKKACRMQTFQTARYGALKYKIQSGRPFQTA